MNDLPNDGVTEQTRQGGQHGHQSVPHIAPLERTHAKVFLLGCTKIDDGHLFARMGMATRIGDEGALMEDLTCCQRQLDEF